MQEELVGLNAKMAHHLGSSDNTTEDETFSYAKEYCKDRGGVSFAMYVGDGY